MGVDQASAVQFEPSTRDVGLTQLLDVLVAQSLVWCDQDDIVQGTLVVVQELAVVQVQQQCLAAPRRHPESQLVEVGLGERSKGRFRRAATDVSFPDVVIQRSQERALATEALIQEHLGV